jgi:glycosyltransferase involved in cell wall biosynthesis
VKLLGRLSDQEVADLLGKARAFVHAAEEDFGIALVEAQAAGCPVIAYGKGGAREIVIDGVTGLLFTEQTVDNLIAGVERFEQSDFHLEAGELRRSAERFSKAQFQRELKTLVENTWDHFKSGKQMTW